MFKFWDYDFEGTIDSSYFFNFFIFNKMRQMKTT